MKWITLGEYRKMSPDERKIAMKKEIELSKDMSLDDLYAELGKMDFPQSFKE
jgi:hypothetical protein